MSDAKESPWRNFYFLVAGKFVSDIGTYLDMVVFPVYAYSLTKSGLYTGLFMASRFLGSFLSGFVSGILADKFNRKHLMMLADFFRSLALLGLAFGPEGYQLPILYVTAFVVGAFNTLFDVCLHSSIPAMLGQSQRVKANSFLGSSQSIAMVIGCLTGGLLVSAVGFQTAFLIDGLTYLVSLLNLAFLNVKTSESTQPQTKKTGFSLKESLVEVFHYSRTIPIVVTMMGIRLLDCFGSAAHNIGIPLLSAKLNPLKPTFFVGIVYAAWAVGRLGSAYAMTQLQKRFQFQGLEFEKIFSVGTVLMSLSFILLFVFHVPAVVMLIAVLAGFADGITDICYTSRLQHTPDEMRGRIFGVSSTLIPIGFGVGTLIASPLFDILAPGTVVAILHGLPIVVTVSAVIYFIRK